MYFFAFDVASILFCTFVIHIVIRFHLVPDWRTLDGLRAPPSSPFTIPEGSIITMSTLFPAAFLSFPLIQPSLFYVIPLPRSGQRTAPPNGSCPAAALLTASLGICCLICILKVHVLLRC